MDYLKGKIVKQLVDFFETDFRRINHALEVLKHAEKIAETQEKFENDIVIACALLHDVGIKPSEQELGYNNGATQEQYGPPIAEQLLQRIDFPPEKITKVKEIIGNHHSRTRYDYVELAILKKADAIVNRMDRD